MKAPPSKKKLAQAQKEGNVLKSQLVTRSAVTFAAIILLTFLVPAVWAHTKILLEYLWSRGATQPELMGSMALQFAAVVSLVVLAVLVLAAVVAESAQVGGVWYPHLVGVRADRMNPAKGAKKIAAGFGQLWVVLLKLVCAGGVIVWASVRAVREVSVALVTSGSAIAVETAMRGVRSVLLWGAAAVALCGVLEYVLQRRRYMKDLEMTPEELKREFKEDEGDPHVKSHRRGMQQEMMHEALVAQVRRAKVIIVEKA